MQSWSLGTLNLIVLISRYQRQQLTWWPTATHIPAMTPWSPPCPLQRTLSGRRNSSVLCFETNQGSLWFNSTTVQYVHVCTVCTCTSNLKKKKKRHQCTIVILQKSCRCTVHNQIQKVSAKFRVTATVCLSIGREQQKLERKIKTFNQESELEHSKTRILKRRKKNCYHLVENRHFMLIHIYR